MAQIADFGFETTATFTPPPRIGAAGSHGRVFNAAAAGVLHLRDVAEILCDEVGSGADALTPLLALRANDFKNRRLTTLERLAVTKLYDESFWQPRRHEYEEISKSMYAFPRYSRTLKINKKFNVEYNIQQLIFSDRQSEEEYCKEAQEARILLKKAVEKHDSNPAAGFRYVALHGSSDIAIGRFWIVAPVVVAGECYPEYEKLPIVFPRLRDSFAPLFAA